MKRLCVLVLTLFFTLSAEESTPSSPDIGSPIEQSPIQTFTSPTQDEFESAFKRMLITLVGILFLVFITIWMFKKVSKGRLEQGNKISDIKILEKRPLSPKTMLYLLQIGKNQVLLSESHLEVTKLKSFSLHEEDDQ